MKIDDTAIVHSETKIAEDVVIGPYAIVEKNVEIGSGTSIGAHVVISSNTNIGKNNKIYQFASIGTTPQHLGYKGEDTYLEIGNNNTIREYCSLHKGTKQGGGLTKIGNDNFLMAYVHIAHDCKLGNNNIFANNATLGGHVKVGNYVGFGGLVAISQFCMVGSYSFIIGGSALSKDILPYTLVFGNNHMINSNIGGLNLVGLKRNGFSSDVIKKLKQAYKIIYSKNLTIKQVIPRLQEIVTDCPEVQLLIDGIQNSERGILR